jgi:hypothetical protein
MLVLVFATNIITELENLKQSLEMWNYNYKVLGIGEKWEGFIHKQKSVINFLNTYTGDEEIIAVIDGYDVLVCGSPEEVCLKYFKLTKNKKILFGGEKFCFSYNGTPLRQYEKYNVFSVRKYLNGGICIGNKSDISRMYNWMINYSIKTGILDDQKIACKYANVFERRIVVDIHSQVILNTITSIDENNFKKGGAGQARKAGNRIISLSQKPCFIHFPSIKSDNYSRYINFGKYILGDVFKTPDIKWRLPKNLFYYLNFVYSGIS